MKKVIVSLMFIALSATTLAEGGDLTIPGERWQTTFNKYICNNVVTNAATPVEFSRINVQFGNVTTDYTLDNGLMKATFEENGKVCNYSAILLADNALSTIKLVTSKAYAVNGDTECTEGQKVIDDAFKGPNQYLYYGHPHNLAVMIPVSDAGNICPGQETMGVNFVLTGKLD